MPMYLSSGLSQLLTHLYVGAEIIIYDGIMLGRQIVKQMLEHKATNTIVVTYVLKQLIDYASQRNGISLINCKNIYVAGGYTPPHYIKQFIELFEGSALNQMYGQTEASPRVTQLVERWNEKIGSVGIPIRGVEVKIVKDEKECIIGEIGEIIVRGKNVMKGYFRQAENTTAVIKQGWLHTGDLGFFDNEGFLYIKGRKRNVIISCGLNIYPEEIEEVLLQMQEIKEAYVYGVLDESKGEEVAAKIVLKKDEVNSDDIKKFCLEKLSNYKVPTKIEFVNQIAKTPTGKIRREKRYLS